MNMRRDSMTRFLRGPNPCGDHSQFSPRPRGAGARSTFAPNEPRRHADHVGRSMLQRFHGVLAIAKSVSLNCANRFFLMPITEIRFI
jgi:hypothetical protein